MSLNYSPFFLLCAFLPSFLFSAAKLVPWCPLISWRKQARNEGPKSGRKTFSLCDEGTFEVNLLPSSPGWSSSSLSKMAQLEWKKALIFYFFQRRYNSHRTDGAAQNSIPIWIKKGRNIHMIIRSAFQQTVTLLRLTPMQHSLNPRQKKFLLFLVSTEKEEKCAEKRGKN